RRRHTRFSRDWSSDVCSSDLSVDFTQLIKQFLNTNHVLDRITLQRVIGIDHQLAGGPLRFFRGNIQVTLQHIGINKFKRKNAERSEERRVGKEDRSRS